MEEAITYSIYAADIDVCCFFSLSLFKTQCLINKKYPSAFIQMDKY